MANNEQVIRLGRPWNFQEDPQEPPRLPPRGRNLARLNLDGVGQEDNLGAPLPNEENIFGGLARRLIFDGEAPADPLDPRVPLGAHKMAEEND